MTEKKKRKPRQYKFQDFTGMRFGSLVVVQRIYEYDKKGNKVAKWECDCDCGRKANVTTNNLKFGHSKTCGCSFRTKNGLGKSRINKIYSGMLDRCYNEKNKRFDYYGERGIKVCVEWQGEDGFLNFYNWAMNNGYKDNLTLDRKDVNGNYEPSNCRWATMKEQGNNKTTSVYIEVNGEKRTASQWEEITGVKAATIYIRYRKGYQGEDLITKSLSKVHKNFGKKMKKANKNLI
jgi:hypothetical protein